MSKDSFIFITTIGYAGSFGMLGGVKCNDRKSLFIGDRVTIDTLFPENIHIGKNVHITTGVIILTHGLDTSQKGTCWISYQVDIGEGSFIGANSIICGKAKIGENAIVGAGSIITKDVPPNEIWAGNPAHFIRKR